MGIDNISKPSFFNTGNNKSCKNSKYQTDLQDFFSFFPVIFPLIPKPQLGKILLLKKIDISYLLEKTIQLIFTLPKLGLGKEVKSGKSAFPIGRLGTRESHLSIINY
ncbi:MAG: hypothetical protein IPM38_13635 [Ignavibacteria bacterium]|nr:hypothetical protein [Ignavibacteria bacterium]